MADVVSLVAGVDVSTRSVDIVLLADDNTAEWTSVPCRDERGPFFAARQAAGFMPKGTFWDDVYLVGVEKPFSQGRQVVRALALITGAVAGALPASVTAIETTAQEWKRLTVGNPQATKQTVKAWALSERFGWNGETQDAVDAYCIARAVRLLNDRAVAA